MHSTAAPIRTARGEDITQPSFFWVFRGRHSKGPDRDDLAAFVSDILGCWVPTEHIPEEVPPPVHSVQQLVPETSDDNVSEVVTESVSQSDGSALKYIREQLTTATSSTDTNVPA